MSTINLNNDLNKIKNWTIQCKMNFNPDSSKQAQEVAFSRKLQKTNHDQVYLNHSIQQVPSQKNLGMHPDTKLNFHEDLINVLSKVNKTIGLLLQPQAFSSRQSLVTVFRAFIGPLLDYRDIIYDQTYNGSFYQKMESIQHNTALAITRDVRAGGFFLELEHFDKQSSATKKERYQQEKMSSFVSRKLLKVAS